MLIWVSVDSYFLTFSLGRYLSWGFGDMFDEYFGMVNDQVRDSLFSRNLDDRINPMVSGLSFILMEVFIMGLGSMASKRQNTRE